MKHSEIAPPRPSKVSGPKEPGCADPSPDADAPVPADIRGPSAEDWDRYKRTIVNMYGTMKLKDIRERMAKDHGFHATKRMYDRRFHKWGVSKYVKRAKPAQAKRSDQPSSPPSTRRNDAPPKQELPDWSNAAGLDVWRTTMQLTVSPDNAAYDDSVESQSSESSDATISGSWVDSKEDMSDARWFRTSAATSPTSPPCSCDECHYQSRAEGGQPAEATDEIYTNTAFGSLNIVKPLPRDPAAFDMERVLSSLKAFCSSQFDGRGRAHPYRSTSVSNPTSPAVRQTWMQLHDCIYLFKLNDTRRAIAGLEEIRQLPPSSLIDHSPQVALEVVASLAPINTARYPYIRRFILSHVLRAAHSELGAQHPVTVICTHLSRDGDSQAVSRTALSCLAQQLASGRGDDDAAFRLRVRLAAVDMLRREADYPAAVGLAKEVLAAAEREFGPGSPQPRRAARKLTHVYLDSGDHAGALEMCRSVVGRQTAAEAFAFQDYDAVRGMEDLAEVHRLRGEFQSSSLWLSAAADLSARLLGRSLTTVHIVDKLLDMAERAGQREECAAYQRTYASYL
ncbi:hypothetical protein NKR19_g4918 [Coniochaeta hoffmannii]|uniref:Clr5 domain-containing protein n=1 Tax=Coniochaeta hoffmannii TaxID=91930 RepID=A0AA38RNG2_9PEZI|nr:hypothetical protein NKR19_g4918 [Coniochaeta hoffmannii]